MGLRFSTVSDPMPSLGYTYENGPFAIIIELKFPDSIAYLETSITVINTLWLASQILPWYG